jgi:hypothetical protein
MKICGLNEADFPRIRCASINYWLPLPPGEGWGEGSLASECRRNKIVTIVTTRHARHAAPFITPGLGGFRGRQRTRHHRPPYATPISTILSLSTPRGICTSTCSPTFLPTSPWPIGLLSRILFWS